MSLKVFGQHEQNTLDQIQMSIDNGAVKAVLCADGHKGYSVPIGGVVAYPDKISLSAVGFDIACGIKAVKTDAKWDDIKKSQSQIADDIVANVSFGVGRVNPAPIDDPLFDDGAWQIPEIKRLKQSASQQLGTCGSGNHFVDILIDEDQNVWVAAHFGSRGLGHQIASNYIQVAGGSDGMDVPPCLLDVNSTLGKDYLEGMRLAGLYAYAGRNYVVNLVVQQILKAAVIDDVHNHHNFAWKETHGKDELWVARKGSTPAFPGQRGFVGSSMGGRSAVVRGIDSSDSRDSLYSTVHGAGRIMSRTQAAGKMKWLPGPDGKKRPKRVTKGLVDETSMRQKIKNQNIELRGGGADEAPDVYRKLEDVLEHHSGTIQVETWLSPKIVVMAESGEFDPYKD